MLCMFNSKEEVEVFIEKVAKIASEYNIPLGDKALLLLKSISLYLYYECNEEDRSVLSIGELLNRCFDDDYSPTTFERMLSFPKVNPEPFQIYERFIAAVGSSQSKKYYGAVIVCQVIMSLYCKQQEIITPSPQGV